MIVSFKHKFLFIKTRKTAGSTFEKLVQPYLDKDAGDICTGSMQDNTPSMNMEINNRKGLYTGHAPFKKVEFMIDKSWWIFTIERNPWDKVVSQYFFIEKYGEPRKIAKYKEHFHKFTAYPADYMKYESAFDYDFNLFKYEEMNEMYRMLYKKTGIDIKKELVEKTKTKGHFRLVKDYKEMYNENQKKIDEVGKVFLPEIQLLGYKYGE